MASVNNNKDDGKINDTHVAARDQNQVLTCSHAMYNLPLLG